MDKDKEIISEMEMLLFTTPEGQIQFEAYFENENFWVTQAKMAELFNVDVSGISRHINNIFADGELDEKNNLQFLQIVNSKKPVAFYSLDVVIAVGYRAKSPRATDFRKWATAVLHEYIQKGYAMNDERLKQGYHFDRQYFKELIERIREIRISERQLYLQVTDIFATAVDYSAKSEITKEFFKFVQNKLHYAITGNTAPEIIFDRADKNKEHMGLETWKLAPDGKILKTDVTVAKNYLNKTELQRLARAVTAFLDIAEQRADRQIPTDMGQWLKIMDGYLDLNDYPKLQHAGRISRKDADEKALAEYAEFRIRQDKEYLGDYEKEIMGRLPQADNHEE